MPPTLIIMIKVYHPLFTFHQTDTLCRSSPFVDHAYLFLAIGQLRLPPFSRYPAALHLLSLIWHYGVEILQTEVLVNLSQSKWRLASRRLCGYPTASKSFLSYLLGCMASHISVPLPLTYVGLADSPLLT